MTEEQLMQAAIKLCFLRGLQPLEQVEVIRDGDFSLIPRWQQLTKEIMYYQDLLTAINYGMSKGDQDVEHYRS